MAGGLYASSSSETVSQDVTPERDIVGAAAADIWPKKTPASASSTVAGTHGHDMPSTVRTKRLPAE
jgi:hypothetical protein